MFHSQARQTDQAEYQHARKRLYESSVIAHNITNGCKYGNHKKCHYPIHKHPRKSFLLHTKLLLIFPLLFYYFGAALHACHTLCPGPIRWAAYFPFFIAL